MFGQARTLLLLPVLLYFRLFIPLVKGENTHADWNPGSDTDTDSSIRESLGEKVSLSSLTNNGKDYAPSLWASVADAEGATAKDLFNPGGLDLRRLQSLQQAKRLLQQQQQSGSSALNGPISIDYPYDDFAQQYQPGLPNTAISEDYVQQPPNIHIPGRFKVKTVRPARYSRYLFSNYKRARDGYMCHFKLCQVGASGKRLSM